jgi:hypothetical protein
MARPAAGAAPARGRGRWGRRTPGVACTAVARRLCAAAACAVACAGCRGPAREAPALRAGAAPSRASAPAPDGPNQALEFSAASAADTFGCGRPGGSTPAGGISVTGAVTAVGRDELRADACPPTADCSAPRAWRFTLRAPGLSALDEYLVKGAFVRVAFEVHGGPACRQRVLIEAVPRWEGEPDPAGGESALFLAAADGFVAAPSGAPFTVRACAPGAPAASLEVAAAGRRVAAARGHSVSWTPASGERWSAGTVRAGGCDDPPGWAWWVAARPPAR